MIEDQIAASIFQGNSEKTFVDKLLARQDVDKIRSLMKKTSLTRGDLNELLNLISSAEQKLANFNDWDRYIVLKYFVWVREGVKVGELLYDQKDDWEEKENTCKTCQQDIAKQKCKCSIKENDYRYNKLVSIYNDQCKIMKINFNLIRKEKEKIKVRIRMVKLDDDTKKLFQNTMRQMEHNIKFMIDLYLNIVRSTLSLNAVAFKEISQNKYEISYPQQLQGMQQQQTENKTGGFHKK